MTIDVATKARPLADGAADGAVRPLAVLNNAFGFGGHNVTLAFTEFIPQEG